MARPADDQPGPDDGPRAAGAAVPGDLPPAVRAANWKRVLVVDAVVGVTGVLLGLLVVRGAIGLVLLGAGLAYLLLVGRRAVVWRRLRRDAGLDG